MATAERVETKEIVDVEKLKNELEQVKSERDQYKQAYQQLAEQNTNVWGMNWAKQRTPCRRLP